MTSSTIRKSKISRQNLRNTWSYRALTHKQANQLLVLQKKSKENIQNIKYFGAQLNEKRKFSSQFPGISSSYLVKKFDQTRKTKSVVRIDGLLTFLERRLDLVLIRIGFCRSILNARQMISHNEILINGSIVNISSYSLKNGDFISLNKMWSLTDKKDVEIIFKNNVKTIPHIEVNYKTWQAIFLYSPQIIYYTSHFDSDLVCNYMNNRSLM
jgi:ribosomal protein S4